MKEHRLAVLGNPIDHSRSPEIHRAFSQQAGIDLSYERIKVADGEFNRVAENLLAQGYTGFNVTVPCKGDAYRFPGHCSASATRSEAVNTIRVGDDAQILGDNTDGRGLVRDLTENLGWNIHNQRVLLLGAGGAARGVLWDLLQASPEFVHLHNRTASKASAIVNNSQDKRLICVAEDELQEGYDLIINATSAGLQGRLPILPDRILSTQSRCYDMSYGPGITSFNNWCRRTSGCEISDGLGMLVEQAALSFFLWFSKEVKTSSVISSLRSRL